MSQIELDGPVVGGLYLRDAIDGEIATVKDLDDAKHQVQVFFPHDRVDTYKTTFSRDAFKESFADRLPLMCWQHDLRDPIGHAIDAQVTSKGNEMVGQFSDFDAVPNAKRAYSQIDDGTITDFSMGFRDPHYRAHPRHRGVREISKAIMKEMSPVSIGSIPGAKATGLREDDPMSEHSAAEIADLVRAEVITPEEGRKMLAQIEGFREHITVVAPLPTEADPNAFATVEGQSLIAAESLRQAVPLPMDRAVTANDILGALPEHWQEALIPVMDIQIAPKGTLRAADENAAPALDEGAETLIGLIESGCRSADEWLADIDLEQLPEDVRQSIGLFRAAGVAAGSLIDVLGLEPRDDGDYDADDPEDMDPHQVKCDMCAGTGKTEDHKTCPKCGGSGIEATTRAFTLPSDAPADAQMCPNCRGKGCGKCAGKGWSTMAEAASHAPKMKKRAVPDDAPTGSKSCALCKGSGKIREGHVKCPKCHGKGWMSPSDQESDTRTDEELEAEADESQRAAEAEDAELVAELERAQAKLERVAAKA